jgi:hypothetical protein
MTIEKYHARKGIFILLPAVLFFGLVFISTLRAQTTLGYIKVKTAASTANLRVIDVASAISAGNGVVKVSLPGGVIGAADLVATSSSFASPVRVMTPYGVRSWRKASTFAAAYGGNNTDNFYTIVKTSDGNFALSGISKSWASYNFDAWISKADDDGNIYWSSTFGYAADDYANSAIQRTDGGYVQIGNTWQSGSIYMYVNIINSSGGLTLGGWWTPSTGHTSGADVIQCSDGNFTAVGYAYGSGGGAYDVFIKKFDIGGNSIWTYNLGGSNSEFGQSLLQRADGGYVVVGYNSISGNDNAIFYLLNSNGIFENGWTIGGTGSEYANAVIPAVNGGYVFIGYTTSFGAGGYDIYINKQGSSGGAIWSRALGSTGNEGGQDIIATADGGYAIAGYTNSYGLGYDDGWLIKTDSAGIPEWSWVFGSIYEDMAYSLQQTSDGNYWVVGNTSGFQSAGDALFITFTSDGSSCLGSSIPWGDGMTPPGNGQDIIRAIRVDQIGVATIGPCQTEVFLTSTPFKDGKLVESKSSRGSVTPTITTICD